MHAEIKQQVHQEVAQFMDNLADTGLIQGHTVLYPTLTLESVAPRSDTAQEGIIENIHRQSHRILTDTDGKVTACNTFAAAPHITIPDLHLLTWWYGNRPVDMASLGLQIMEHDTNEPMQVIDLLAQALTDNFVQLQQRMRQKSMSNQQYSIYHNTGYSNNPHRSRGPMSSEINHWNVCAVVDDTHNRKLAPISNPELWKMIGVHDTIFMNIFGHTLRRRFAQLMREHNSTIPATLQIFEEHDISLDGLHIGNNEGFDITFDEPQSIHTLLEYVALFHGLGKQTFKLAQDIHKTALRDLLPYYPNKDDLVAATTQQYESQFEQLGYHPSEAQRFIAYTLSFKPTIGELTQLAHELPAAHPVHTELERARELQQKLSGPDAIARFVHDYAQQHGISTTNAEILLQPTIHRVSPGRPENAWTARMPSTTGIMDSHFSRDQNTIRAPRIRISPRFLSLQGWGESAYRARLNRATGR